MHARITRLFAIVGVALLSTVAMSQDISVGLSTQEGYVGLPIALQITVVNGRGVELPETPVIDGCEVELAGQPSQSRQTTIINGRRSTTRSLRIRYLITPQRTGEFEVPGIRITASGRDYVTESLPFVVTKSETGDLLFAEVTGSKSQVYVGEPLEQTLRLWIKPFRDPDLDLTLTESHMWQMVSEQSSWGSFGDRIEELMKQRRRPAGREVLREDKSGNRRSYYLYEITADTYPKRPGRINADDLRIVVNYPTRLGREENPFSDFFNSSPFGNDPFFSSPFRGSPFGNRLTVESARPIVAEAKVDSTDVLPIPTEGRPADYRGAVGRYQIVARASPLQVNAGDPISLQIGIGGNGPMELVQAPPLAELADLTKDFKVTDQDLPGFVKNSTKMFSTTIRPRGPGVTRIPPIPLSFFNPEKEAFETVYSEPISIEVSEAETLALDAIVGGRSESGNGGAVERSSSASSPSSPQLEIFVDDTCLTSESATDSNWRWPLLLAPSLLWIAALGYRVRHQVARMLSSLRAPHRQAQVALSRAESAQGLAASLQTYIARRTRAECSSPTAAVGQLRLAGMLDAANAAESWISRCERAGQPGHAEPIEPLREAGLQLLEQLQEAFEHQGRVKIRRLPARNTMVRSGSWLLTLVLTATAAAGGDGSADSSAPPLQLTAEQQRMIFAEANASYEEGVKNKADAAAAKDAFQAAATKYEQLAASGISNHRLYFNLGNACLQLGDAPRAAAYFEKARRIAPSDRAVLRNLRFAQSQLRGNAAGPRDGSADSLLAAGPWMEWNQAIHDRIGPAWVWWCAGLSSLTFWSLLAWRVLIRPQRRPSPETGWLCLAALLVGSAAAGSLALADEHRRTHDGLVVAADLELRAARGESLPVTHTIDDARGMYVDVVKQREEWLEVVVAGDQRGWAPQDAIIDLGAVP